MKAIEFYLPEPLYRCVHRLAKEKRKRISTLIREIVTLHLGSSCANLIKPGTLETVRANEVGFPRQLLTKYRTDMFYIHTNEKKLKKLPEDIRSFLREHPEVYEKCKGKFVYFPKNAPERVGDLAKVDEILNSLDIVGTELIKLNIPRKEVMFFLAQLESKIEKSKDIRVISWEKIRKRLYQRLRLREKQIKLETNT
ncbi:MAG TPA: hypothetical protein PKU67_07150 [Candidatus Hydrothermia bacterium]|nr:hypothetical protein [Candidatus Hydrothermia bacterium]HOL24487.1 hypothetical protein [Candidatus Hydrothermia bacterium]